MHARLRKVDKKSFPAPLFSHGHIGHRRTCVRRGTARPVRARGRGTETRLVQTQKQKKKEVDGKDRSKSPEPTAADGRIELA